MSIKLANLFGVEQEADATPTAARTVLYYATGQPTQLTPFLDGGIVATTDTFLTALGTTPPRWLLYNWSGYTVQITALRMQFHKEANAAQAVLSRFQLARVVHTGQLVFTGSTTPVPFMPKRTQTGLGRNLWNSLTYDLNSFGFIGGTRVPGDLWEGIAPRAWDDLATGTFFYSAQYEPISAADTPFELAHREAIALFSVGAVSTGERFNLQAEVASFRGKQAS